MKAVLGALPPDDAAWAYEIKFDGYRTLAFVGGGRLRLQSANLLDVTARYPELSGLPGSLNGAEAVLDGEMVVLDDAGRPSFELLQRHSGGDRQALLFVFDVLQLDGHPTIGLPYEQRRTLLGGALEEGTNWSVPAHRVGDGPALFAATGAEGLEGVMAKRLGSRYMPGVRSREWRKIKHRRRVRVAVGGWTEGTGRRATTFGALLVGVREPDGRLRFAGGVGSGFTDEALDELAARLASLASRECPFDPPPPRAHQRGAHWVRPELVAEVEIAEWTNDGYVRQATFAGLLPA